MQSNAKLLKIIDIITLVIAIILFMIATYMVFFYAEQEAVMGQVQRVFYFHVAAGWVGMLSFFVAAAFGVVFLITSNRLWDIVELAAVEIGMVFAFINVVTGSIWARPIWNTWWTWDPRLTTATIMLLIYAAYVMLRAGIDDPDRRARFGAIYAIVGFLSVPLTFFSARLFRTIHPVVIAAEQSGVTGEFAMEPKMFQTFMFSLVAFTFVFFALLWHRIRIGILSDKVEQLKLKTFG